MTCSKLNELTSFMAARHQAIQCVDDKERRNQAMRPWGIRRAYQFACRYVSWSTILYGSK